MTFNFSTKQFELSEEERGKLLATVHPTDFTTGQVAKALAAVYSANFEQDLHDVLNDLMELQEADSE